jgi:hypothetical protein
MNIIQAIDSLRIGENNHTEYNWSEDIKEEVVQLYFQLVRTKDMTQLEKKVNDILTKAFSNTKQYKSEIILLYKMIANVRDIAGNGKGEMDLSYMMLYCLYNHSPTMAYYLFENFVIIPGEHQYGSWKDVKYFCNYVINKSADAFHPFIGYIVRLTNYYLKDEIKKEQNTLYLLGRWIPREKSKKFGWLFKLLAKDYFSIYLQTAKTVEEKKKATLKAYCNYRKVLSELNRKLNTVQIKMCNKDWKNINPNQLTSKTMNKQMLSLLNQKKGGRKLVERYDLEDRKVCATTIKQHLDDVKNKKCDKKINGKRCDLYEYVRDVLKFSQYGESAQAQLDIINAQWEDNKTNSIAQTTKIIPLCDVSGSMESDNCIPLYNAIGLSIRLSEITHPAFRNRVLTFSNNPQWINLENENTLVEKVRKLKTADWGMNTDLYAAMRKILDALIENEVGPSEVKNLVLAIFSDMQIDQAYTDNRKTLQFRLKTMFELAGLESTYREPYPVPHILYWNLRTTSGFPTKTTEENVTMFSGYNASLLNVFSEKGMDELTNVTPYMMLNSTLNVSRYESLEERAKLLLS